MWLCFYKKLIHLSTGLLHAVGWYATLLNSRKASGETSLDTNHLFMLQIALDYNASIMLHFVSVRWAKLEFFLFSCIKLTSSWKFPSKKPKLWFFSRSAEKQKKNSLHLHYEQWLPWAININATTFINLWVPIEITYVVPVLRWGEFISKIWPLEFFFFMTSPILYILITPDPETRRDFQIRQDLINTKTKNIKQHWTFGIFFFYIRF